MRVAAAEARRVLVAMAADKLDVPADQLTVNDGVVHAGERCCKEGQLRRAHRRALFQRPPRLERQIRQSALRAGQGASRKIQKITRSSASRSSATTSRRRCLRKRISVTDIKVPGMVHARMIRPPIAGAVPVSVDESSIKNIPTAKVVWDKGFLGVVADKEWDAIKAAQQLKVSLVGHRAAIPRSGCALRSHPQGDAAQARGGARGNRQCRRGVQVGGARDRGRIRMAVPIAFQHGAGLRAGRDQGRQGHLLERHAEIAFRARRPRRHPGNAGGCRPRDLDAGSGLLRPQRCRRRGDGCRRARQSGRQAGARAIHARPGHRLGSQGSGLDPSRPRRDRCPGQRRRLRLRQQGLLARRRRYQRQQAVRHAGRPDARRRAEIRRRVRRAGGILSLRQQAHRLGDDRAAARPRLAVAHRRICAIRSGRKSTSPANPSWTKWPRR